MEEDVGSAGFFYKDIISFLQYLKEKRREYRKNTQL